jgi:hypothetical protein
MHWAAQAVPESWVEIGSIRVAQAENVPVR